VFAAQTRQAAPTARWKIKPMEAELADPAVEVMVVEPKKSTSASRRSLLR
jgi:hypothetical protein